MFEKLKALYKKGRLTEDGLTNAVKKAWITEDQKKEILESVE